MQDLSRLVLVLGRLSRFPGWAAAVIFTLGLLLTWGLTHWHQVQNETAAIQQLKLTTTALAESVRLRLSASYHALFEVRGVLSGQLANSRSAEYEESHRLLRELSSFSGVVSVGYAARVGPAETSALLSELSQGYAHPIALRTEESNSGERFVITRTSDKKMLGTDLSSLPAVREAGMRAIWHSEAVLSRPLVQADGRQIFYLLLPVFSQGAGADNSMQRRENVQGLIFVQVAADHVIAGVADPAIELQLFDRENDFEKYSLLGKDPSGDQLRYEFLQPVGGRSWYFVGTPSATFYQGLGQVPALVTAVVGSVLSLMVSLLAYILLSMQKRIRREVDQVTGALKQSEKRQRAIFENASVGILFTVNQKTEQANPKTAELFGWSSPEEIRGLPGRDYWLSDEDYAEVGRQAGPVLATGGLYETERLMQRKDGSTFLAHIRTKAVEEIVDQQAAIWIIEDVTEQRRTERQLQANEQLMSEILEGSPIAMFVIDAEHRVTHWNQACARLTGSPTAEVVGTTNAWGGYVQGPRPVLANLVLEQVPAEKIASFYSDKFWSSELVNGAFEAEDFFPTMKPSGRWLHFMAAPLRDAEGRIIGAVETLVDVTARREAEVALEKAYSELAEAMASLQNTQRELVRHEKLAALGELVAGVAHELNTPIGNALTVSSTIKDAAQDFQQAVAMGGVRRSALETYLDDTLRGSELLIRNLGRAARLIDSFKQLAVNQRTSGHRRFPVADVLRQVCSLMQAQCSEQGGHRIEWSVDGSLEMESYPGELEQVLLALISNALVHAFDGRDPGTVALWARLGENPETLILDVTDNGCGISAENLPRVFDPFFTTRLGHGSSGLGLHLVYNQVTRVMEGQVDAFNLPEGGACFRLVLPLRVVPDAQS